MAANNDLFSKEWCNLVFDQRYRKYGGYELRTKSSARVVRSLIIASSLILLLFAGPLLIRQIFPEKRQHDRTVRVLSDFKIEQPEADEIITELPPPPEPLRNSIKFVPPVVKPDETVADEPPPTQKELLEDTRSIGTVDFDKGSDDIAAPVANSENAQIAGQTEVPLTMADQMPQFPGGQKEMMRFIKLNLHYPAAAQANGIQGTVLVNFVVDKEGKITNIKVIKGIGYGCDEESVRVMSSMPLWSPGRQRGQTVLVSFTMPLRFVLN